MKTAMGSGDDKKAQHEVTQASDTLMMSFKQNGRDESRSDSIA